MTEHEIDSAVIKRTQSSLGKYVKKPVLSEKLLKKPPFRFLHDVFNVVIKDTGCFAGLYSAEELNYEHIKDRESKMKFLQKMIDAITITTNTTLNVRTSKIVAGHEPEKTNELLALLGEVIEKQLDWKMAVQQVVGDSVDDNKEKKPLIKQISIEKSKDNKPKEKVREKPQEQEKQKAKLSKTISPNKPEVNPKQSKEKEKITRRVSKDKPPQETKEKVRRASKDITEKTKPSKAKEKSASPKKPTEVVTSTIQLKKEQSVEETNQEAENLSKQQIITSAEETNDLQSTTEVLQKTEVEALNENHKSLGKNHRTEEPAIESPNKLLEVAATKAHTISSKPPIQSQEITKSTDSAVVKRERESTFTRENSLESTVQVSRPRTSLRPPSARPASARPGAPRRRDKNVEIVLQPNDAVTMSGINVKLEAFGDFDDDGEHLVVIEDATNSESANHKQAPTSSAIENEQQGHLVQQILETQKELVQQNADVNKQSNERINSATVRQSSARQMNTLRDVIQNLTKSVNPLGKLMDFVPEDIDAMQLELTMWRESYAQAAQELKREKSVTESATEPMKHQLAQIEDSIKEYAEMIDNSRVKILQNSEKILKLLSTN